MLALSMIWGLQQVPIKLTAPEVSLLAQGGIRSIIATLLVFAWARWQGLHLFSRDGTLPAGIAAGLLFAFEFVFIYFGLGHTAASPAAGTAPMAWRAACFRRRRAGVLGRVFRA